MPSLPFGVAEAGHTAVDRADGRLLTETPHSKVRWIQFGTATPPKSRVHGIHVFDTFPMQHLGVDNRGGLHMRGSRVLLVEDDADTREITGLLLDHAGYEVIATQDLAEGIALSQEHRDIGIVLADMYLGGGQTGILLIREIRRNGLQVPIVLTSADDGVRVAARDLNVHFLPKPYGRQALLCAMNWARVAGA
jgi:CheY-like chemotaxis protein